MIKQPSTDIGPSHRPPTGYVPPASLFSTAPMFGTRLGLEYPTPQIEGTVGGTWNAVTGELLTGHRARTLAEASPGSTILNGGGGDAHAVEMVIGLTAGAGERGGSQALIVDEAGGRVVYIDIDALTSQQSASDQGSAAATRATNPLTAIGPSYRTPAGYVPPVSFGSLHRGITVGGTWDAVTGQKLIGHRAHMLAQASPGPTIIGAGDDAHALEMVIGSTAGARERGGSQARIVDEEGGRFVSVGMDAHASQQSAGDQGSAAAARTANDGVDVQQVLSTLFGGLVVLSVTNLHGTSKEDYPEFIKFGLFIGCLLLIVLTFHGLMMKNMGKAAMRVAAGMSIAAVTISAVYEVSEKVYIKCIIGSLGAMVTVAMAVIKWR